MARDCAENAFLSHQLSIFFISNTFSSENAVMQTRKARVQIQYKIITKIKLKVDADQLH